MVFNLRKTLLSFLLAAVLLPVIAFANTEFKGTETVNINRADAATLAAYLKGVGVNKAEAIVKYRKANGKFKGIKDLTNVPGIGDETFKDNQRKLSTSRGKSVAPEGYKLGKSSEKSKLSSKKSTTKKAKKSKIKKSISSSKDNDDSSKSTSKKSTTKSSDKKPTKKKSSKSSKTEKKSTKKAKKSSTNKKKKKSIKKDK